MWLVSDLLARMAVALYLVAIPLMLLAGPAMILFAITYLLAGPEFRIRMVGWAPGFRHGVRQTALLAKALQGRSAGSPR